MKNGRIYLIFLLTSKTRRTLKRITTLGVTGARGCWFEDIISSFPSDVCVCRECVSVFTHNRGHGCMGPGLTCSMGLWRPYRLLNSPGALCFGQYRTFASVLCVRVCLSLSLRVIVQLCPILGIWTLSRLCVGVGEWGCVCVWLCVCVCVFWGNWHPFFPNETF